MNCCLHNKTALLLPSEAQRSVLRIPLPPAAALRRNPCSNASNPTRTRFRPYSSLHPAKLPRPVAFFPDEHPATAVPAGSGGGGGGGGSGYNGPKGTTALFPLASAPSNVPIEYTSANSKWLKNKWIFNAASPYTPFALAFLPGAHTLPCAVSHTDSLFGSGTRSSNSIVTVYVGW